MLHTELLPNVPGASPKSAAGGVIAHMRETARSELFSLARQIDEGFYPAGLLRRLGAEGAWRTHVSPAPDLAPAIEGMAALSEACMATGFMAWCQNTLVWYLLNSSNEAARSTYLEAVASGRTLGGTALSNPMKSFCGIEGLKLKGRRVEGGYMVRGALPWVSNLGPDHLFGAIFEAEGTQPHAVMCLIDCAEAAVTLRSCPSFLSMDGTGTYSVNVRELFVPDSMVLADPAGPYVEKIRAGFVLLQAGMAIGVVRDCVRMMKEVRKPLGHVNRFLEVQPEDIAAKLTVLEAEVRALACTPHDTSAGYWRRVLEARLAGGEAAVKAAHYAMLHCGARGYVESHRCQRRLREAYFVAIVTPATKQLRLMLSELPA